MPAANPHLILDRIRQAEVSRIGHQQINTAPNSTGCLNETANRLARVTLHPSRNRLAKDHDKALRKSIGGENTPFSVTIAVINS